MSEILIANEVRSRMESAMSMEAGELINDYRESLKFPENPLSEIYEAEILIRLWRLKSLLNRWNINENYSKISQR